MSEKEEIFEDLKKNYTLPGHPIAFSGINNIHSGHLIFIPLAISRSKIKVVY